MWRSPEPEELYKLMESSEHLQVQARLAVYLRVSHNLHGAFNAKGVLVKHAWLATQTRQLCSHSAADNTELEALNNALKEHG